MSRRGRPPGRTLEAPVTVRITAELRAAIEREAAASGRTVSAVAQEWLHLGGRAKALGIDL